MFDICQTLVGFDLINKLVTYIPLCYHANTRGDFMKKKNIILSTLIFVLLGFIVYKGADYYQDRYRGTEYYLKVPIDTNQELEPIFDSDGKQRDTGKEYTFTVINTDLEKKEVNFTIITDDESKLLAPGEYLKVIASNQISLSETRISEMEVPEAIIDYLDDLN